jgi:hypothetical protein
MAERTLIVTIQANDRHCQSEPGQCCEFLFSQRSSPRSQEASPICLLFPTLVLGVVRAGMAGSDPVTPLSTENGWPVRCEECLAKEAPRG